MEVVQSANPTESPMDTMLYKVIDRVVQNEDSKGYVLPYLSAGATDSRFFRNNGITSYGFMPILISESELQANLGAGTRILYEVIQEISHC
jgi:acetylornithine deacetylase/succinyl-diaminopimelate desuccinylase-like protein